MAMFWKSWSNTWGCHFLFLLIVLFWGERNRWMNKDKDKKKRVPVVSSQNGLWKKRAAGLEVSWNDWKVLVCYMLMEFAFGCAVELGFAWHNQIPQNGTGKGILAVAGIAHAFVFFPKIPSGPPYAKYAWRNLAIVPLLWLRSLIFHSPIAQNSELGGGSKDFLFSPLPGEMIQFD